MGRDSETQLQVGKNINLYTLAFEGLMVVRFTDDLGLQDITQTHSVPDYDMFTKCAVRNKRQ